MTCHKFMMMVMWPRRWSIILDQDTITATIPDLDDYCAADDVLLKESGGSQKK